MSLAVLLSGLLTVPLLVLLAVPLLVLLAVPLLVLLAVPLLVPLIVLGGGAARKLVSTATLIQMAPQIALLRPGPRIWLALELQS